MRHICFLKFLMGLMMDIKVTFDDAVVAQWQLNERKIKEAVALLLYHRSEVTMGAAAEIVGCSKDEFNELMKQNDVFFKYGDDDLSDELEILGSLKNGGEV